MANDEGRIRDPAARQALIVATTRALAEKEGWEAVTTRRLAAEIEYSQPILFKHFASMEDIVAAVTLEGFNELAQALATARRDGTKPLESLRSVARAWHGFAIANPAVYDAMFTRSSPLSFGVARTPAPRRTAFAELRATVAAALSDDDVEALTSVLWATLHGLTTLERNVRLRRDRRDERIDLLLKQFIGAHSKRPRAR